VRAGGIEACMEIEQIKPKKPNFLLIVILFCVTILVVFVLAYFFVDYEGGHLRFRHHTQHPTSQLVLPAASDRVASLV
jgi:flagellar basal body-associated protein FliL